MGMETGLGAFWLRWGHRLDLTVSGYQWGSKAVTSTCIVLLSDVIVLEALRSHQFVLGQVAKLNGCMLILGTRMSVCKGPKECSNTWDTLRMASSCHITNSGSCFWASILLLASGEHFFVGDKFLDVNFRSLGIFFLTYFFLKSIKSKCFWC